MNEARRKRKKKSKRITRLNELKVPEQNEGVDSNRVIKAIFFLLTIVNDLLL